jgi:hypothetical protein
MFSVPVPLKPTLRAYPRTNVHVYT